MGDVLSHNMLVIIYNQLMIMHRSQMIKECHDAGLVSDETYKQHLAEMSSKMLNWRPMTIEGVTI